MNYNLLDEEWIPVLYHDGQWKRLGIRKVLEDAGADSTNRCKQSYGPGWRFCGFCLRYCIGAEVILQTA